jgi:MYXO-CTERM domain-containing protein
MDDRLTDLLLRAAAVFLTIAGLIAVIIGYLGVRNQNDIVLQAPYFISGGVGGLALLGLGALALIQYQMRQQARRFAEVTESLDEWKEAALAEIRGFLEGAQIEVEVLAPASNGRTRSRRPVETVEDLG